MITNGKTSNTKRKPNPRSDVEWLKAMLTGVPAEVATEAAYYAIRELKKSSLFEAPSSEPTREGRALASQIVSEIAAHEGITKSELSTERAAHYIKNLSDAMFEVRRKGRPVRPGLGKRLLAELRAKYKMA